MNNASAYLSHPARPDDVDGFVHVRETIGGVMKEILRRVELRGRSEAERRGPITDQEFLEIANNTGMKL